MRPLIISAPFGNYIKRPEFTSTLGTFTLHYRGGWMKRLWRMALTLRYDWHMGGWVNRLGLPNPGIDWLFSRVASGKISILDKIVSISVVPGGDQLAQLDELLTHCDWIESKLLTRALAWELNLSCPNLDHADDSTNIGLSAEAANLFAAWLNREQRLGIIKVPPVRCGRMIDTYRAAGIRWVHASNTLPCAHGGLSGPALIPLTIETLEYLRGSEMRVIAGGGVKYIGDVERYMSLGAHRVAIGSALLNPLSWIGSRSRVASFASWSRYTALRATLQEPVDRLRDEIRDRRKEN